MSTELALRNADPIALGEVMHKSGMFPDTKNAVIAAVKIMAGAEYALGAVASMSGIHVIDNKPVPGAHVLAGLVKRGTRYDYLVFAHDNTRCVLDFFDRQGKPVPPPPAEADPPTLALYQRQTAAPGRYLGESEFTFDDAKRAGLSGRTNWQRYPRNMLFARALANGVRWYCPDVTQTGQVLVAEEAADLAGVDYAPPGAVAEPVRVENVAAKWRPSRENIEALSALYVKTGWWERERPEGFEGEWPPPNHDEHGRLRMLLLGVGADNGLRKDKPALGVGECLASLDETQFGQVHAALAEAAVTGTFDATAEGEPEAKA